MQGKKASETKRSEKQPYELIDFPPNMDGSKAWTASMAEASTGLSVRGKRKMREED